MKVAIATDNKQALLQYVLHLADTSIILAQRLGEWCGHGPVLEQDIAMSNIGLDLIGQARSLYQYAAELQGEGKTEDDLAFLRNEREFYNLLLVEQPNGNFADTIARQFFFDTYHYFLLERLQQSSDETLAGIAAKSFKEVAYHLKWSSEWIIRLGDGTDESKHKMQAAIDNVWTYTGELTTPTAFEKQLAVEGIIPDIASLKDAWHEKVSSILEEATLTMPVAGLWMQTGGKLGTHTEHLGFMLAEMQYLQRTYPGLKW